MFNEIQQAAKSAEAAGLYEGTVTKTVVSESAGIFVRVKGFKGTRGRDAFGPLPWKPRYDPGDTTSIRYPDVGDRCWVAFDDDGEGVVLDYVDPDWF